ncbi:hypothetical protein HIM_00513 [Hirsutella minnesotensis 3608]|nr:hypothetical protein HIM_00513 [Hirsutella minnesotensis 3608]
MTSFFQPDSFDPTIKECGRSTFDVYCNYIVPASHRFQSPYQTVTLVLGSAALVLPLVAWFFLLLRKSRVGKLFRALRPTSKTQFAGLRGSETDLPLKLNEGTSVGPGADSESPAEWETQPYNAAILPLGFNKPGQEEGDARKSARLTVGTIAALKRRLGCVSLDALGAGALEDTGLKQTIDSLAEVCRERTLAGLALKFSSSKPRQVEALMEGLSSRKISVLVLLHHDSPVLDSISLDHACGVVIQNAVILPSGERRDYFQAKPLRSIMARCIKERETRPEFFIGFLELWNQRPHPSIIRRAVKLAEHFGASIAHACTASAFDDQVHHIEAERTLSAFEYLKRPDLQGYWTTEKRSVWIPNGRPAPQMVPLRTDKMASVIPSALEWFRHEPLSPSLMKLQSELPTFLQPPEYISLAPNRDDFWHASRDGNALAKHGCYSICSEPSCQDYDTIVDTQQHLKELDMLHYMKGVASFKLLEALRSLVRLEGCGHLIQDLIEGLESQKIRVYKGLDTGFRLPDGGASFWGVSRVRDPHEKLCVDIFISQKAPDNATTILHTWLAHHNVPRDLRYDFELLLEAARDPESVSDAELPVSIKAGIERATHAETLQLLQQIHLTQVGGSLRGPMINCCHSFLIQQTSTASRVQSYGRRLLDGSMTMREALTARLETLARLGATELPAVENLLHLHDAVDVVVRDALFFGDRESLNSLLRVLVQAFDIQSTKPPSHVDINADIFALIFFSALRRAAFEDVYNEATDRCPLFLQPDQAAVFSELWVLGSQCEGYFGILPRDLGEVIYDRYHRFLADRPPQTSDRTDNEIMTMYSSAESGPQSTDVAKRSKWRATLGGQTTVFEKLEKWKTRFAEFGAMSIFCLPAILDVVLLTFVGRGMFMTAFMHPDHLRAAVYALLISLLLSAGVVGWVGSTGNYYLAHYAYDNMVHFHVQRLSGGFVLTAGVAACGFIVFSAVESPTAGLVFVAFLVGITTYLNLLGILATMHQRHSPMTSGRSVVWRNIPLLLLAPLISSFVNGHDLEIYLPLIYLFLFSLFFQYRKLCHEWCGWMRNITDFSDKDVLEWYVARNKSTMESGEESQARGKDAQEAFREAVSAYSRRTRSAASSGLMGDAFVGRVANSMPYIKWLFTKTAPDGDLPPAFSSGWFTQLGDAKKQQQQLSQGLKEHNLFILFRMARYDIGQNLGLFLVALMDRWVSVIMAARQPHASLYTDGRARYGICFCILYFSFSVMILDVVLQKYWSLRFTSSKEPLADFHHAKIVAKDWENMRRRTLIKALFELFRKIIGIFGVTTMLLWVFVESSETMTLYYLYVLGYTSVIIFQFNRCFTTSVRAHIIIIFSSAAVGLVLGCILHAIPATAGWLYSDVVAQNCAAVLAAVGTFIWSWNDFSTPEVNKLTRGPAKSCEERGIWAQRMLRAEAGNEFDLSLVKSRKLNGISVAYEDGSTTAQIIGQLIHKSKEHKNAIASQASWSNELLETALRMWTTGRIRVLAVEHERFVSAGLGDVCSFGQLDDRGVLIVKIGVFGKTELRTPSWHSLLATVATEAIFYHVARVEMMRPHAQAIQAEHFHLETVGLSKRIELELGLGDANDLKRVIRKSNPELMRHLCWGIDVEADWQTIPQGARQAIFSRIAGEPVAITEELNQWIADNQMDLQTIDFHLALSLKIYDNCLERFMSTVFFSEGNGLDAIEPAPQLKPVRVSVLKAPGNFLKRLSRFLTATSLSVVKWIAIISGGGANIERELCYSLHNVFCGRLILLPTLLVWKACRKLKDLMIYALLVYHRPTLVHITRLAQKGERRKIVGNAMVLDQARQPMTVFAARGSGGDEAHMVVEAFDGLLQAPPMEKKATFTATYDEHFRLRSREEKDGTSTTYNYSSHSFQRRPQSKEAVGKKYRTLGIYDGQGRIKHGIVTLEDESRLSFSYHYKTTPKGNAIILAADFIPIVDSDSDDRLSVFWGLPPKDGAADKYDWVPSDKVYRIVRIINGKRFVTEFEYRHRRDPISTTVLEADHNVRTAIAEVPKLPFEDEFLLQKPTNLSFDSEDVLIRHSALQAKRMRQHAASELSILSRWSPLHLWKRKVYLSVPTWRIRTELWNAWLKGGLDAATACGMDELILREEPLLHSYWRARERGRLEQAKRFLDENVNQIVSAIDLETDISELCLLPIRTADLYAMGLGRDATEVTNRPQDAYSDTKDRLSVIVNDIGCWPEAPGGVSNCRRDLVNGHSTIRNHVLAECANDFGIPRFQVEKNVQSLKLLPLWGLDGKTAYHGLMTNITQSEVDDKIRNTDMQRDIINVFIPLLKDFVKGARTKSYSRSDLIKYTNVFLSMSKYYEHKDYNQTWSSKVVEDAWAEAWLIPYNDPNVTDPAQHFDIQRPSMADFKDALGIYLAYFFIFSVNIPEECPRVFQSTHHGISSLFGMLLKYRRGVTFGIWDHAILWRESCLNISPAQCELPIPVQSMLLAGIRLASRLAYFHADIVVPCTSLFNPMWEADIGTDKGKLCSKNEFQRKIDPIVNGISNMESFTPVDKVRTDKPTVVMLSNVQFIKGIKTAILAADVIVNRYGFHDYKLVVYGAKDRQPSYALEMAKLIVKCNLSENVILAGFGKPKEVLKDAWLFVNSSISEGLPLAIGEAALAGVPIVATEVGATALVVTDPDDESQRYGEVVAPNDPVALARAQLSLLCMVGPWARFTEEGEKSDVGNLPEEITDEDVEWLSQRMYDKSDARRRLGLLSREVVLHSFHGRRYLREHEQMYWIQWHMAKMRADQALGSGIKNAYRFGSLPPLRYAEPEPLAEEETAKQVEDDYMEEEEAERWTLVESPAPSFDSEAQTVRSSDLRARLSELMTPSFLGQNKHHGSRHAPYSLGGSTAASSFSNWAPG